ncbi:hypothetical protein [Allobaculum stercoricanis]|uniref:hypothetical protein n=1 Tax=Allobaculum stercoricanis TaxID=174709 RepID=UPI0023F2AAE1|nr:hypothetical protein [Allobaculum stercoricanis]
MEETQSLEKESAYEATANGKTYSTLKEALEAGGEVKLLKDVEVNEIIEINNDTTLDLGDFTITNNVTAARPFNVYANNFTVKANKGGMVIPESNSQSYGFVNMYGQNLSILGGQYSGDTKNGRLFIMRIPQEQETKIGTVFVKDIVAKTNFEIIGSNDQDTFQKFNGTISNSEFYTGTRAFCFPVSDKSETSTISISNTKVVAKRGLALEAAGGNTILSNNDWTVTGDYNGGDSSARTAVGVGNGANVTIKSGNYSAKSEHMKENEGYGVYLYPSGGIVNIEGGMFEGTTASLMASNDTANPATIVVNGGQFTGDLLTKIHSGKANIVVNAGDFNGITDKTLAEGNNVQIDGGAFDKDVKTKTPDAKDKEIVIITRNDSLRYVYGKPSVEEALSNTAPGDKVEIIQNITSVTVPGGVEVENSTGNDVTVNGTVVKNDETITTPAPSTGGGGGATVKLNPVYRAYNPNNGEHLYTVDEKEYKHVASVGWTAEGVAFMAEEEKNGQALYRVYNPNSGLHHYTLDEKEKNTLVSLGWHDEKVAWYSSKKPQSAPVFRVYNPNDGNHHYTMNKQEKDVLVSLGWQDEGLAFRTSPIEK